MIGQTSGEYAIKWTPILNQAKNYILKISLKFWMYENHMCELRSEELRWRMIIRVTHATFAVAKRKTEKKCRLVRDSHPWPLRDRCSALPIKLTSQDKSNLRYYPIRNGNIASVYYLLLFSFLSFSMFFFCLFVLSWFLYWSSISLAYLYIHVTFNNYSPKAQLILLNNPRH